MHPIPQPDLLDPDRLTTNERSDMTADEHRTRAQQIDQALHESCEYATELWQHLDAARTYLLASLPSDPRAPGTNPHACASPTGPTDAEGWQRWIETYATVTSILAGPRGDSGFGLGEAREAARLRREAPNLKVLAATNPNVPNPEPAANPVPAPRPSPWRAIGLAALGVLALRGLGRRSTT
jgi:hypothetical protein